MRSLFPKLENFKTYFFERQVNVSLCSEVWEKSENKIHKAKIEEILEMEGLKYFSTTRPRGKRGGGAAIIVNKDKFKYKSPIIWKLSGHWPNQKLKMHSLRKLSCAHFTLLPGQG